MNLTSIIAAPFNAIGELFRSESTAISHGDPRVPDDYDSRQGEPYEISDNDRDDAYINEHFRSLGDLWAHTEAETRCNAEEKADQETRNSGFLKGAAKQYAQEVIGAYGPAFEINRAWEPMLCGVNSRGEELASEYERQFSSWLWHIQFARKMRSIVNTELPRGEGLGFFHPIAGEELEAWEHPVPVSFMVRDARRLEDNTLAHAFKVPVEQREGRFKDFIDGIRYDAYEEPVEYRIDKVSPAARAGHLGLTNELPDDKRFDIVPAARVVHWFQWDYPEQRRGFTQWAASLMPSILIRRGGMSITKAIKNAAQIFGWVETPELPPEPVTQNGKTYVTHKRSKPGKLVRWRDNALKVLGGGQQIKMTDQKLPSGGTWDHFNSMAGWAARAICAPLFMFTGDYSKANFTSTRAGYQPWDCYVGTSQVDLIHDAFEKALRVWHDQAVLVPGYLSAELRSQLIRRPSYPPVPYCHFHFAGRPAISPDVEAKGNTKNLAMGKVTHAEIVKGGDPITKWKAEAKKKGIPFDVFVAMKESYIHQIKFTDLVSAMRAGQSQEDEQGDSQQDESDESSEGSAKADFAISCGEGLEEN